MALIGATADLDRSGGTPGLGNTGATLFLPRLYCEAIEQAGAIPVLLSPTRSAASASRLLDRIDGLLISGGHFDIHPRLYGEKPLAGLGAVKAERTRFELNLTRLALKRDLPLLGICGGAQAINVALGGTLYQDIATQLPQAIEHQQSARKNVGGHPIHIQAGTRLARIVKRPAVEVNTTHHQAIKRLGRGLVVNAISPDGLIEGIESPRHSFVLGVQWHPEALVAKFLHQRKIFSAFVNACRAFRRRS